jgi:TetR/AcrR family transcriptional repressor of nem operon
MRRYDFKRGCLVGNLGQEMGVLPEGYRARLRQVLADWEARTTRCLRQAQAAREISSEIDCENVAAFFWIGWEGAVLRAKLDGGPAALRTFANGFFAALK